MTDRLARTDGPGGATAVRVGIVGCGRVVERGYLPALAKLPAFELVALADTEAQRCRTLAPSVPSYTSAAALVAEAELDVVVVATPAAAHVEDARAAAAAGRVALVEKPPAPSAAEAQALARLTPAPWVGFNRRFEPRLEAIRDGVRGGSHLAFEVELAIDQRAWGAYTGSADVLLDLGSHAVDLVAWLAGRPIERARARRLAPATVGLELELSGATARATISHERRWTERLEVRDRRGVRVGAFRAGGWTGRVGARLGVASFATLPELLAAQLRAVGERLGDVTSASPLATAEDGVRAIAVLDALRVSLDSGSNWVEPAVGALPDQSSRLRAGV